MENTTTPITLPPPQQQQQQSSQSQLDILENYFGQFQKAVNDGIKINNVVSKFDVIYNVESVFNQLNKQQIDSVTSKWLTLLCNCLTQHTGSPSLALVIGSLLSKLFDYPQGGKLSTTIIKNLITTFQTKTSTIQIKTTIIDVLGIVFKNSKTLAVVYLNEMFTLLSRQIKASSEISMKPSCLRCLSLILENTGYAASNIHQDCFRLLKSVYVTGPTITTEFKIESLNCIISIMKYYNRNELKLDGLDEKMLNFIIKVMDEENIKIRNKLSETLGQLLSIAYYNEAQQQPQQQSQQQPQQLQQKTGVTQSSISQKTQWNMETCLTFLGNNFVSIQKKELRTNSSLGYCYFLQNLKLTDVEKHMELIVRSLLRLLNPMYNKAIAANNVNDQIQCNACVSYILRQGIGEKLSETGQQSLVRLFTQLISQSESLNELVINASLKELCQLINELGEGGITNTEDLSTQLLNLLSDKNQSTRQWSSICLRALATCLPKYTSKYLSECLQNLNTVIPEFEKLNIQPDHLKKIMNTLKGNALGCASLIATIKKTELGVPITLLNHITKISSTLLTNPDFMNPAITLAKLEAGWSIMNSLIKFMGSSFVESILPNLFIFWKNCFNITTAHPPAERDIIIFARTRADALAPLHSFIQSNPKLLTPKVVASIVNFLGTTLKTVSDLPAISSSFHISTNELTRLLEMNLIKTFLALTPQSYVTHHTALMQVVTSLILDGPQNTMVSTLLSKDDEDSLLPDFTSLQQQFENLYQIPISTQDTTIPSYLNINDCFTFKSTQNLEIRVVNNAIELFSCLFIAQHDRHKTQLLDHLSNCIKECVNPNQKNSMIINSLTSILFILKSMASNNNRFGKSEITNNVQRFVQKYFGDVNPLLRRLSAESLGVLCRIEGDNVTSAIIKSLTEIIRKPSKEVSSTIRSGSAFVLGCIQRSVGVMMSQKYLPTTIANLHVLAQDLVSPDVSTYALHSLYITIQTSGFSFTSFAAPTLMLIQQLLMNENPPFQLLGRIVNSIVVALGPELEHKKDIMQKCSSTCSIIQKNEDPSIRVESIYFYQKLILFAPNTINDGIVVPHLISQFKSPYLLLRIAAVTCLRQIIQKRSQFQMDNQLCETIFMMIDTERDQQLQKELKLLLFTLIDTVAPSNPSTWLKLCMGIILSTRYDSGPEFNTTSGGKDLNTSQNGTNSKSSKSNEGDVGQKDEDEEEEGEKVVVEKSDSKLEYVHRWFTKIFALECVRRVISVVRNKPEHFSMVLANQQPIHNRNDFLVYHLHDLIGIAYKAATSQIDSMRPVGILLLEDILDGFGSAIDPDYEGHLLLELYQAQIMSALRPAFSSDANPTQLAIGCSVFVGFLESSLNYDSSAIKKATTLLISYIKDLRNLNFPIYNEKTTTLVQLSILKAFARLYLLCNKNESLNRILSPVISPVHWITFLKEYSLLVSQSPQIYTMCKPIFFSPLAYQDSIDYFKDSYPSIIKALASLIGSTYWLAGRGNDDSKLLSLTVTEKEFLNETKPIDDFFLIFCLTILPMERYLDDPQPRNFNVDQNLISLETISLIFSNEKHPLTLNEFSIVMY
eukprot:gene5936-7391_t